MTLKPMGCAIRILYILGSLHVSPHSIPEYTWTYQMMHSLQNIYYYIKNKTLSRALYTARQWRLHFTGLSYIFLNDKVVLVPGKEVAFSSNLSICAMSVRQVLSLYAQKLNYSFLTSLRLQLMANLFSSRAPQFFSSSAAILLVVWSANGSSKVNLLNDDTYRCDSATIIMSSFGQIEQGAH